MFAANGPRTQADTTDPAPKDARSRRCLFRLDELEAWENGARLEVVQTAGGGRIVRPVDGCESVYAQAFESFCLTATATSRAEQKVARRAKRDASQLCAPVRALATQCRLCELAWLSAPNVRFRAGCHPPCKERARDLEQPADRRIDSTPSFKVAPGSHANGTRGETRLLPTDAKPHDSPKHQQAHPLLTRMVRRGSTVRVRQRA